MSTGIGKMIENALLTYRANKELQRSPAKALMLYINAENPRGVARASRECAEERNYAAIMHGFSQAPDMFPINALHHVLTGAGKTSNTKAEVDALAMLAEEHPDKAEGDLYEISERAIQTDLVLAEYCTEKACDALPESRLLRLQRSRTNHIIQEAVRQQDALVELTKTLIKSYQPSPHKWSNRGYDTSYALNHLRSMRDSDDTIVRSIGEGTPISRYGSMMNLTEAQERTLQKISGLLQFWAPYARFEDTTLRLTHDLMTHVWNQFVKEGMDYESTERMARDLAYSLYKKQIPVGEVFDLGLESVLQHTGVHAEVAAAGLKNHYITLFRKMSFDFDRFKSKKRLLPHLEEAAQICESIYIGVSQAVTSIRNLPSGIFTGEYNRVSRTIVKNIGQSLVQNIRTLNAETSSFEESFLEADIKTEDLADILLWDRGDRWKFKFADHCIETYCKGKSTITNQSNGNIGRDSLQRLFSKAISKNGNKPENNGHTGYEKQSGSRKNRRRTQGPYDRSRNTMTTISDRGRIRQLHPVRN